ncbi:MAG: ABC transporter ATP-binding protein [Planctomycetota bacterium]
MSETSLAIEIRGLRKVYGSGKSQVVAVDGLDLEVRRGEIFGLLGPNGAGKTTTVEVCEGLTEPTDGDVVVLGQRWNGGDALALRQRIGVSLQETRFFEKLTVREVLGVFRSFYRESRSVAECLDLLSLHEKANARTRDLSGGQRQRLAVACALIGHPELLFLDEPTTGLDPQSRRQLWEVFLRFRDDGGTILLTTHYMDEAAQLCERIGIVDHGKRIALGTPEELVATLGADHVVEVDIQGSDHGLTEADLQRLPGVSGVRLEAEAVSLSVSAPHLTIPPLLAGLARRGLALEGLRTRHVSLEDVFVGLTGRHLRDGGA